MVLKLLLIVLLLASLGHVSCGGKEKKDLTPGKIENVFQKLDFLNKGFSDVHEIYKKADKAKLVESAILLTGVVPLYGSILASSIKFAQAFFPMSDPVIEAMKIQFDEVNRKLVQVQWDSYASIYSQDESNIRNSWDKYLEFLESSIETPDMKEKKRMGERFTTFYEGTATESSVARLYSYLTITQPSLQLNLLDIMVKKLKGDLELVIKHSLYFRNLLFTGYQMNLVYYALKDVKTERLAKKATTEFQTANAAIHKAWLNCFNSYEMYMTEDVKLIGTTQSLDYSQLAKEIKKFLDKKYDWYDWIVVGFQTEDRKRFKFHSSFSKFEFGENSVAVSHSLKGLQNDKTKKDIEDAINKCIIDKTCSDKDIIGVIDACIKNGKIMYWGKHISIEKAVAGFYFFKNVKNRSENPMPFLTVNCKKGKGSISIFSQSEEKLKPPACPKCISGTCTQLLDTTVGICTCETSFYGPQCDKNIMTD